jgi:hypothetical protein
MPPPPRDQVFISYSHKDRAWLKKLQAMLKPLVRNHSISVWDDTKIKAGAKWKEEIEGALALAKIAVLLVSHNFLDSDFIAQNELPPLLNAAAKEGLVILWVYVGSCLYDETEIKDYQAAHDISKPLNSLRPAAQATVLVNVCKTIKAAWVAPSSPPLPVPPKIETRDAEGFFTELGITRLIDEASGSGEKSEGALLIFKTQKQRTWLVATHLKLYCIVDDLNRRKTGKLIQWSMLLYETSPIEITDSDIQERGFLNIGKRKKWYYSKHLLPTHDALIQAINRLILIGKSARQEDEMLPPQ